MGDQLRLCRHSTQDIMWMYHHAQADKIIQGDSLTKPTISYKVGVQLRNSSFRVSKRPL